MAVGPALLRDIEEALDELRHETVNKNFKRAAKVKSVLLDFLPSLGYTIVEDIEKVYVLKEIK